jgi:hypothetical protein
MVLATPESRPGVSSGSVEADGRNSDRAVATMAKKKADHQRNDAESCKASDDIDGDNADSVGKMSRPN